jgi:hypothetical protein
MSKLYFASTVPITNMTWFTHPDRPSGLLRCLGRTEEKNTRKLSSLMQQRCGMKRRVLSLAVQRRRTSYLRVRAIFSL